MRPTPALMVTLALLAATQAAHATMNKLHPPGYVAGAPAPDAATAKTMSDDSSGLRSGTIERVDVQRGTLTVHGQTVRFDPTRVRIFDASGKPQNASSLARGARLRFSVDPRDGGRNRAVVIYVE